MFGRVCSLAAILACLSCFHGHVRAVHAQSLPGWLFPERKCLEIREPGQLAQIQMPSVPDPRTVAPPEEEPEPWQMSLDTAIRIALSNSEVVRVLAGTSVTSSGRTVYDPAIANTDVDRARSVFDPTIGVGNQWDRTETPVGVSDAAAPSGTRIDGDGIDQYNMGLDASKTTVTGGTAQLRVTANPWRTNEIGFGRPPLNPSTAASVDLSYTQPLLQGGGRRVNLAPILIARIETERSFYQLRESVQLLVRGVVEGYWALVFARTDVWARQQQVKQAQWAYDLAEATFRKGLGDAGDRAQARSTLANFRAQLVTAQANLLDREAALRNILGIPPSDAREIVPVTPPQQTWFELDWPSILQMAGQFRNDLIERKLILENDEQQLLIARNQAFPRVDAKALYRWDHLQGKGLNDGWVAAEPGRFTGWQLGVDVTVPLGLADARAELRRWELTVMRDQANLDQAMHEATHDLAASYRALAKSFEEYRAFKDTREASRINLDAQSARWSTGLTIYLNVLQAIASWGDAIDAEAQSLLQYNTELVNLEQNMGTILESHFIQFTEDSFPSMGPMGRLFPQHCYPADRRPCPNLDRYPAGSEPAENVFDLDDLDLPRRRADELPAPRQPATGGQLPATGEEESSLPPSTPSLNDYFRRAQPPEPLPVPPANEPRQP
jgi:outer membrane protein TolC